MIDHFIDHETKLIDHWFIMNNHWLTLEWLTIDSSEIWLATLSMQNQLH